jgi:hypothetical protein
MLTSPSCREQRYHKRGYVNRVVRGGVIIESDVEETLLGSVSLDLISVTRVQTQVTCVEVYFKLIKQFMNSLKAAKQAKSICYYTNSSLPALCCQTSGSLQRPRMAVGAVPVLSHKLSYFRNSLMPPTLGKCKYSGPLPIPHRLWSRLRQWTD